MRIDKLKLPNFKDLLVDFEVDFDVASTKQVIVGRNGVGKSNLLEAIATIFCDLDLQQQSDFEYEIEYHCNGHFVRINSSKTKTGHSRTYHAANATALSVDASSLELEKITQKQFYEWNAPINGKQNPKRLLPLYVFGYYAGVSKRFEKIFSQHEALYYKEQITGEEAPLRPLFLAKPHHSQFALISFFAASDEKAEKFLRKEFKIRGLESALFGLHEPYYANANRPEQAGQDKRFWSVGGKVAALVSRLFDQSLAPMSGRQDVEISIGRSTKKQKRYCFIPDQLRLQALADGLAPKEFFAQLESSIFSDLIDPNQEKDLRIRILLEGSDASILFEELSEGERQLLTIVGLMRFTAEKESLFLLDEPDTFFNPAWCLDCLSNLVEYGVEPPNSQIIMTTHNPLTFAGLDAGEVVILERGIDGRIVAHHPSTSPRGMGFGAILTSEFFGMRSALDLETLKKIDEKRDLGFKANKTDGELRRLADLNEELSQLDFSNSLRDPLYLEFTRAMTEAQRLNPGISNTTDDKSKWRMRREIAADIAKRLQGLGSK